MPGPPRLTTARALGLGIAAGLLAGLFGVGGGVVLVPGLVLLLGLDQHRAHATSLVAILVTAPAAMLPFVLDDSVAYVAGLTVAAGAIAGAWLGALVMHRLSPTRLRQAFAVLLLLVAVRMLFPAGDLQAAGGLEAGWWWFLLVGLAAGTLSALMGVGGGTILVPAFVLLFGATQHLAEGTSLLVIIPTALMGATQHARRGYTEWQIGLLVGATGAAGGLIGAQTALALDAVALQRLFAGFLMIMGLRMLVRRRPEADADTVAD